MTIDDASARKGPTIAVDEAEAAATNAIAAAICPRLRVPVKARWLADAKPVQPRSDGKERTE
jgi:hypothetical protein